MLHVTLVSNVTYVVEYLAGFGKIAEPKRYGKSKKQPSNRNLFPTISYVPTFKP